MNYLILLFTILLSHFSNAQSSSTLFVKNKATDNIKKVYYVGDKVTLIYRNSENKVKGVINEIGESKIMIDSNWYDVAGINAIISNGYMRKLIGIAGMAVGTGIWLKGRSMPIGGEIATDISRFFVTRGGILIATTSMIFLTILPKKYKNDKFIFKTYSAP